MSVLATNRSFEIATYKTSFTFKLLYFFFEMFVWLFVKMCPPLYFIFLIKLCFNTSAMWVSNSEQEKKKSFLKHINTHHSKARGQLQQDWKRSQWPISLISTLNHVQITTVQQTWPCCKTEHQGAEVRSRRAAASPATKNSHVHEVKKRTAS